MAVWHHMNHRSEKKRKKDLRIRIVFVCKILFVSSFFGGNHEAERAVCDWLLKLFWNQTICPKKGVKCPLKKG